MRYCDQGAFFAVSVYRDEVRGFKRRWPCSGLPSAPVTFTFDTQTGDLVDISDDRFDGAAASALADDARDYAERKLRLA